MDWLKDAAAKADKDTFAYLALAALTIGATVQGVPAMTSIGLGGGLFVIYILGRFALSSLQAREAKQASVREIERMTAEWLLKNASSREIEALKTVIDKEADARGN